MNLKSLFSKDRRYLHAIETAPGPAPWYLSQSASDLSRPAAPLHWERDPKAGPTSLKDSEGRLLALASIYTYVWRFNKTHFIVWYAVPLDNSDQSLQGDMRFELYEISALRPLRGVITSSSKKTHFVTNAGPLAEFTLPRNLEPGVQAVDLPPAFSECPEFFVLVSEPGWYSARLNLWSIEPERRHMTVVAQDWFTNGSYDFGYQWVTRIAREPISRDLVGDGVRLGKFLLSSDGNSFKRWLGLRPINS